MEISDLSVDQLYQLRADVTVRINELEALNIIEQFKLNQTFSGYKYYFFDMDGERLLGFGSETDGYLDDRIPEDLNEVFYDLTNSLDLSECMTCTYDFDPSKEAFIENTLREVGMIEGEPEWTE